MKKTAILLVALLAAVSVAEAAIQVKKPAKIDFNDCSTGLEVVAYGMNYITSGTNRGEARVFVTVHAKASVLHGCVFFKVYTTDGKLVVKERKRIKLFAGSDKKYTLKVPASDIRGRDIKAEIGLGCSCYKKGF